MRTCHGPDGKHAAQGSCQAAPAPSQLCVSCLEAVAAPLAAQDKLRLLQPPPRSLCPKPPETTPCTQGNTWQGGMHVSDRLCNLGWALLHVSQLVLLMSSGMPCALCPLLLLLLLLWPAKSKPG